MNSDLVPFVFEGCQVRSVIINGEPWFVAADLCAILELGNVAKAVKGLRKDNITKSNVIDALGRLRPTQFAGSTDTEPILPVEPILPQRTRDYLEHGAQKGQRNKELFDAACQFRDAGSSEDYASGYLGPRAERDGLSMAEILATIRSVYNRQAREPLHGKNGETLSAAEHIPPPKKVDPPRLPDPIPDGLKTLLETCFAKGEWVAISQTKLNANGEAKPGPGDTYLREAWLKRLMRNPINEVYSKARDGLFIRINPIRPNGKADKDVTSLRHCLVEFDLDAQGDRIAKEVQFAKLLESQLPISVVLDSGNKSIHGWVQVDAPDRTEYDRRREIVWEYFSKAGLPVDPQNKNPSRYSRCPGAQRNLYDKDNKFIGTGARNYLRFGSGRPAGKNGKKTKSSRIIPIRNLPSSSKSSGKNTESEIGRFRNRWPKMRSTE